MQQVKGAYPPPHAKYLVLRDSRYFCSNSMLRNASTVVGTRNTYRRIRTYPN